MVRGWQVLRQYPGGLRSRDGRTHWEYRAFQSIDGLPVLHERGFDCFSSPAAALTSGYAEVLGLFELDGETVEADLEIGAQWASLMDSWPWLRQDCIDLCRYIVRRVAIYEGGDELLRTCIALAAAAEQASYVIPVAHDRTVSHSEGAWSCMAQSLRSVLTTPGIHEECLGHLNQWVQSRLYRYSAPQPELERGVLTS